MGYSFSVQGKMGFRDNTFAQGLDAKFQLGEASRTVLGVGYEAIGSSSGFINGPGCNENWDSYPCSLFNGEYGDSDDYRSVKTNWFIHSSPTIELKGGHSFTGEKQDLAVEALIVGGVKLQKIEATYTLDEGGPETLATDGDSTKLARVYLGAEGNILFPFPLTKNEGETIVAGLSLRGGYYISGADQMDDLLSPGYFGAGVIVGLKWGTPQ